MPKFFVEDLSTMKKIIALALAVIMLCALAAVPASAIPEGCTAIDITSDVKFMTTYEMYKTGTPIVRDDALFINVQDDLKIDEPDYYAPGGMGKSRDITIMGLNLKDKMDQLQYDPFFLMPESEEYWADSTWMYYAIWPNIPENIEGYTKARVVYEFEVKTPGEYEFVFVGAAQIKKANIDNDAKDRGFTYSIDNGQKKQVNVSDSPMVFREYEYSYDGQGAKEGKDGDKYYYYQMAYAYNIKEELSVGKHTIEYYHLEYSGDTVTDGSNSSRLNLGGIFVQKYLDEVALASYTYPKYVPEDTETGSETESATQPVTPVDSESGSAEASDSETQKPEEPTNADTKKPDAPKTTEPAANDGGCKSVVVSSAAMIVLACAACVALKKKSK